MFPVWSRRFVVLISTVASGCSDRVGLETEGTEALKLGTQGSSAIKLLVQDVGTILAENQTLRYEATLKNNTNSIVNIVRASALIPCCSSLENIPRSIAPQSEMPITMVFKPGTRSGAKHLEFDIMTDQPEILGWKLILNARVVATWEIAQNDTDSGGAIIVGDGGEREFSVYTRQPADRSVDFPCAVEGSPEIQVTWSGAETSRPTVAGLQETTRRVRVRLPPQEKIGSFKSNIKFKWHDGKERFHVIGWSVFPDIKVTPYAIIERSGDEATVRTIKLTSQRSKFRVTKISGSIKQVLQALPDEYGMKHDIRFILDSSTSSSNNEVKIYTNHNYQKVIKVSISRIR